MISVLAFTSEELKNEIIRIGEKGFRSNQIYQDIYRKLVLSFDKMALLPTTLRRKLTENYTIMSINEVYRIKSKDGSTDKVVFSLLDGKLIESVLIRYKNSAYNTVRKTVCISTQAGCAFGCKFCATGQQGFERHLRPDEIVAQVIHMEQIARHEDCSTEFANSKNSISNVVFMGMGEPLHNYHNTLKAIKILNNPLGFGIGGRHITVSTVGIVPGILRLALEDIRVNLAVSLHTADNKKRSDLLPVNKKWNIKQLIDACHTYCKKTGRRVFFEYVLLMGVNDSAEDARELGKLLQGMDSHVNLIPVNPIDKNEWHKPSREVEQVFKAELSKFNIPATVRTGKGIDIAAGCGQLKSIYKQTDT